MSRKKDKIIEVPLRLPLAVGNWYAKLADDACVPIEHAISLMLVLTLRREQDLMPMIQQVAKERHPG